MPLVVVTVPDPVEPVFVRWAEPVAVAPLPESVVAVAEPDTEPNPTVDCAVAEPSRPWAPLIWAVEEF